MSGSGTSVVVDFWNVGQGDATSIRLPSGELILIDVGPKNSTLSQWLRSGPRGHIKDVILTHNDADHAGALPEIVADLHAAIGRVLLLEDRDFANPRMLALFRPVFHFSGIGSYQVQKLACLGKLPLQLWSDSSRSLSLSLRFPQNTATVPRKPNEASAILTLDQAGKTLITWPGDATLARIVGVVPPVSDMLFGPHHGAPQDRKNKQFQANLQTLSPANCFVSVGTKNHKDKHPNAIYLEQLIKNKCHVFCSQMTHNCDATRVKNGQHVMNTSGYFGLPAPAQGVFCRGHIRLTVSATGLVHDRYQREHQRRLVEDKARGRRLLCATGIAPVICD